MATLVVCAGCAAGPTQDATPRVVYPPAPEAPRLVLLTTYSSARDLQTRSGLERFVAGGQLPDRPFMRPSALAMQSGRLLISDVAEGVVHELDLARKQYRVLQGRGRGILQSPESIALGPAGHLFVGDLQRGAVVVFDRGGNFTSLLGEADGDPVLLRPGDPAGGSEAGGRRWQGPPSHLVALAASERYLFVAKPWRHEVEVFDIRSLTRQWTFGGVEPAPELFFPVGLACDPSGGLLVSDLLTGQVERFSERGKLLQSFGRRGDGPGEFRRPLGIACDREGRVYVADEGRHLVQVFDAEGRFQFLFGGPTRGWAGLRSPRGVVVDYEHVDAYAHLAPPGRSLDYLLLVANEAPDAKVAVFGALRDVGGVE